MKDLKKYVCTSPFQNLEIHDTNNFMCCPSWLPKKISNWNDEDAKDIRKSVMDGSFKYCKTKYCPFLSELLNNKKFSTTNPIVEKNKIPEFIEKNYNPISGHMNIGPGVVQFTFDRSCNFKCPSCRLDIITADGKTIKNIEAKIDEIEIKYGADLKWLYITGSGDPFVSVAFRNFLKNFDPTKYPNLTNIHLHTNASMWTKEMWNSMKAIWPYVTTCEISIDAGTQYTYENITRLGGNWDTLINNLKFINTIPKLTYIKTSFVVQDSNYMEMQIFLNLIKSIFGKKAHIYFGKIINWNTFTEGEFLLKKIWDTKHPEYKLFCNEFDKIWKDPQVFHNMHEIIQIKNTLI